VCRREGKVVEKEEVEVVDVNPRLILHSLKWRNSLEKRMSQLSTGLQAKG